MKRDGGRRAISNRSAKLSGCGVKAIRMRPIFMAKKVYPWVEHQANLLAPTWCRNNRPDPALSDRIGPTRSSGFRPDSAIEARRPSKCAQIHEFRNRVILLEVLQEAAEADVARVALGKMRSMKPSSMMLPFPAPRAGRAPPPRNRARSSAAARAMLAQSTRTPGS